MTSFVGICLCMAKLIIGLTGGIGSGKTAVSDYFAHLGIDVVDADVIAHRLSQRGSPMLNAIKDAFGDWVLDADGNYNRSQMRAFVFNNPANLAKLNAITHPIISQTCLDELARAQSPYAILSVPLLIENKNNRPSLFHACHKILVVDVPTDLQIARASKRDGTDPTQIQAIIARQISRDDRLAHADDVVDNSGDLPHLHQQLAQLHNKYLALTTQT